MNIYSITKSFQNIQRIRIVVFKTCWKVKEPTRKVLVLCQFFDENCGFIKVFEIIRTSGSLIFILFEKTKTNDCLILGYFKKLEWVVL
jgi:hypothetical protein